MKRLYRLVLVLVIMILVGLGLNTSNQGMNSLTLEARAPVLGYHIDESTLSIFALWKEYRYKQDKVQPIIMAVENHTRDYLNITKDYFKRIWRIFKVIFLQ